MKTRNEINELLRAAAAPDTAAEALTAISEEIVTMYDTIEANNATMNQLNEQIADLRDSNMRLFLRVTGEPQKQEEDQEEKLVKTVENKIFEKFNEVN